MIRQAVSIGLLVLAVAGATGCATAETLKKTGPLYRPHVAIKATDAWRDENDTLVVCVNGWHANRPQPAKPEPFSFSLKLGAMDVSPEEAGQIPVYMVPVEQIERACPERPSGAEAIEIERIRAEYVDEYADEGDLPAPPDDAPLAGGDPGREGPVLFYSRDGVDAWSPATLFYLHDAPLLEDSRLVRIALSEQDVRMYWLLIPLLPLAIIIDVLTPVACVASIIAPGAAEACVQGITAAEPRRPTAKGAY